MTFNLVHEPSGEWQLGIWRIKRPAKSTFSIRLFKWAFIWSFE